MKKNLNTMDVDEMIETARTDPDGFEAMRLAAIEELIAQAPPEHRQRLRCLQWRIDQERRNASPMSACIKISKMMWERLVGERGLLEMVKCLDNSAGFDHRADNTADIVRLSAK